MKIVDASWHLPGTGRDAQAEYQAQHLPGAVFFDIDAIADQTSDLPHMLPTPADFARHMEALGISQQDEIIVYDVHGLFSAPRVWWTLRLMGAQNVRLLAGGLPGWRAAGLSLSAQEVLPAPARFEPDFQASAVRSLAQMQRLSAENNVLILDARPKGRFCGTAPEPRPGLPSGHMPGAYNLPFTELVENGRLKAPAQLREAFRKAGVRTSMPVVTTCGSGISAAILNLALAVTGHQQTSLYDGAWSEWAARDDTIILTS